MGQNERFENQRFLRNVLQNSSVNSPKRERVRRLPPKVMHQVSKTSVSYNDKTSCKSEAGSRVRASPPIPTVASSRFPAPATTIQLRHLPCAQNTSPAAKSDDMTSSCLPQKFHHTTRNDFDTCGTPASTKIVTLAETCHKSTAPRQQPGTQIPLSQRHPTPPTDHPANADPMVTAKATEDRTKRCTCAAKLSSTTCYVSTLIHTNLPLHSFIQNLLQKLPPLSRPY